MYKTEYQVGFTGREAPHCLLVALRFWTLRLKRSFYPQSLPIYTFTAKLHQDSINTLLYFNLVIKKKTTSTFGFTITVFYIFPLWQWNESSASVQLIQIQTLLSSWSLLALCDWILKHMLKSFLLTFTASEGRIKETLTVLI